MFFPNKFPAHLKNPSHQRIVAPHRRIVGFFEVRNCSKNPTTTENEKANETEKSKRSVWIRTINGQPCTVFINNFEHRHKTAAAAASHSPQSPSSSTLYGHQVHRCAAAVCGEDRLTGPFCCLAAKQATLLRSTKPVQRTVRKQLNLCSHKIG